MIASESIDVVNPPERRGGQSVTVIYKCSASHVDWDWFTGRHPASHSLLSKFVAGLIPLLTLLCLMPVMDWS